MRQKRKIINLFRDNNVYSIKHVISIDTEEDLNQFWDFMSSTKHYKYEMVHTFISQFYNFGMSYIEKKDSEFFEIILEESLEDFYFTFWNKKIARLFKKSIQNTSLTFLYEDNKISIKLNKVELQSKIEKINQSNKKREKNLIKSVTKTKKIVEPYTFLRSDDLEELIKLNDDMQDLMFQANKVGMQEEIFISLRSVISIFCLTLRYYDEISNMATTLTEFSNLINVNREKFTKLEENELELIHGFIHNIDTWLQTLFVNGGANIYFMDNSIKADYEMIAKLINPHAEEFNEEALEYIFDF